MTLDPGTRLGPYEIVTPIGAGGMGEVYKARDTRLNRHVAIKVVAPHLVGGEEARERFEREARAIASLSHPHICTLHDIGHDCNIDFLVMEYLEGETLATRLARERERSAAPPRAAVKSAPGAATRDGGSDSARVGTPLPLDETLHIASQLAAALAAAHRTGVVHRDLKPANVMLTRAGVKILDFGLAKLRSEPHAVTAGQSATTTAPLSGAGMLIGTLAYMAPEQLEGRDADARTDIFAFGAIVYEMTTGRRAFTGDSPASLIAAILDRDPEPLGAIQPLAQPGLDRLVRKCLAKDPDMRWQSASDVADELRWIAAETRITPEAVAVASRRESWIRRRAAIGATLFLLVTAALGTWQWIRRTSPSVRDVQHRQVTFAGDVVATALSPDGRTVAYAVGENTQSVRVLIRDISGGQALDIWKGQVLYGLAWMPDGSQILVCGSLTERQWGAWTIPRLGGSPRRVGPRAGMCVPSPDGSDVALASAGEEGFHVLSLKDGSSRTVKLSGFRWVQALDWNARANRVVLLTSDDDGVWMVWNALSAGGEARKIYAGKEPIAAVCSSPVADVVYLLRERSGSSDIVRVPMTSSADEPPRVLLSGLPVATPEFAFFLRCTVSGDGRRLLYSRMSSHANLWRFDLTPSTSRTTVLTQGTSLFTFPAVSPDGRWIAATEGTESQAQIVKIPLDGGEPIRLGPGIGPAWSPDGRHLAFVSTRSGSQRVWVTDPDGQRASELKDAEVSSPLVVWLPDGRLAWRPPDGRNWRIRDLKSG